MSIQTVA